MLYEVTINCTLTLRVEARSAGEAETIAREEARIGDAVIVWSNTDRVDDEEAEAA